MVAQPRDPQPVLLSVQLYRRMVRVYPAAFRDQYSSLMVQAFRDSCLAAARQNQGAGLLSLWARTLVDVLLTMIEQYGNRGIQMTKSTWIKLSGWLLVASSFLFPLGWFASSRPIYNESNFASWPIDPFLNVAGTPILLAAMLCIAAGLLGLYVRFKQQVSSLGRSGLITGLLGITSAIVGIIGMSINDSNPWWALLMLGITAMFVGLGLFGVNCIQSRLFSRWNSLPLLSSLPWPLMVVVQLLLNAINRTDTNLPEYIIGLFFIISFVGMALVGYLLMSDANRSQPALV